MFKKILDLQNDILVLMGIFFAIRFIYTKEIYIQVNGYTVNTLNMLIQTIILAAIYRIYGAKDEETNKEEKLIK